MKVSNKITKISLTAPPSSGVTRDYKLAKLVNAVEVSVNTGGLRLTHYRVGDYVPLDHARQLANFPTYEVTVNQNPE